MKCLINNKFYTVPNDTQKDIAETLINSRCIIGAFNLWRIIFISTILSDLLPQFSQAN